MPSTYEPIATQTLGSAAASITFSSIPTTYTDLRVVVVLKAPSGSSSFCNFTFNSDGGANYSYTRLAGDGSTAASNRGTGQSNIRTGTGSAPAGGFAMWTFDIFSYAGSTFKTALLQQSADANGSGTVVSAVGLWRDTTAINTVACNFSSNGDTGTTATLYGIKNA